MGRLFKENKDLPDLVQCYKKSGNTFEIQSLGSFKFNSVEPENLQSIWSIDWKIWGVAPIRFKAQDPFCGRGFITTDGLEWEYSRVLLKLTFNKPNLTDFSAMEKIRMMVSERFPRDRSTLDLLPLMFNLVSPQAPIIAKGATMLAFIIPSSSISRLYGYSASPSIRDPEKPPLRQTLSLRLSIMPCLSQGHASYWGHSNPSPRQKVN